MRLYADGEDVVPEILKQTADHIVDKVTKTELSFELNEADKDQMDIVQVRQQAEKEKAMKAIEVEIEEDIQEERKNLTDQAESRLEAHRKALQDKMESVQTDKERKHLLDQLRNFDNNQKQLLIDEKLKQDRLLEERRKARQNKKQVKALEIK